MNTLEDFERQVNYHVRLAGEGGMVLTAILRDRYHDIELEIEVETESLLIKDARVAFRQAPTRHCVMASERLPELIDVPVARGLSRRLTGILGGSDGCGNLRTMLLGLLPLAVNIRAAAGFEDEEQMLEAVHEKLKGTCAGYPGGG